MSDPHFNHDDPSIPVLTEVLDMPASGQPAGSAHGASSAAAAYAAAPGTPAAPAYLAPGGSAPSSASLEWADLPTLSNATSSSYPAFPPATPQPAASPDLRPGAAPLDEEALDALRVAVLQDLQVRLDPLLKSRMREHVQAAVDQALGDLVDGMQVEVARLVDEALHKELIRQAARQQLPRIRPRDDVDDD